MTSDRQMSCHEIWQHSTDYKVNHVFIKFLWFCLISLDQMASDKRADRLSQNLAALLVFMFSPFVWCFSQWHWRTNTSANPYSNVHGANMGPTWVLSAPDWPHVGPIYLAIRDQLRVPDLAINLHMAWSHHSHHGFLMNCYVTAQFVIVMFILFLECNFIWITSIEFVDVLILHTEVFIKWVTYCRYFQIYFLGWKYFCALCNFIEIRFWRSNDW